MLVLGLSCSSQVTAAPGASSSRVLLLCPRHFLAKHVSKSTGTFLAAPFRLGASLQTDPAAQLVSSYLQVINEIIYCLLLGFCQNTRRKKKKEKKTNCYFQQNCQFTAGQVFVMPSKNGACRTPSLAWGPPGTAVPWAQRCG